MKNVAPPPLRILAACIDLGIYVLVYLLLVQYITSAGTIQEILNASLWSFVLSMLIMTIFYPAVMTLLTSRIGGSPGKILAGLTVVDDRERLVSVRTAFYREVIGKIASGALMWSGYLWILKDPNHQGWHDLIAGTYVIKKSVTGPATGLIALLVLLTANAYAGFSIYTQIVRNFPLYKEIFEDIKGSATRSQPDPVGSYPEFNRFPTSSPSYGFPPETSD